MIPFTTVSLSNLDWTRNLCTSLRVILPGEYRKGGPLPQGGWGSSPTEEQGGYLEGTDQVSPKGDPSVTRIDRD
jgi:hypothetical protein